MQIQVLINDCQEEKRESSQENPGQENCGGMDSSASDSPSDPEYTDTNSGDQTIKARPVKRRKTQRTPPTTTSPKKPTGRGRRAATPLPPPVKRIAKGRHPVISVARRDLADEWHPEKNDKGVDEVTLGSDYRAWWVCKKDESHPAWQERVEKRALKKRGGCPECSKGQ